MLSGKSGNTYNLFSYLLFQIDGANKTKTGIISNLPASMLKDSRILPKFEKPAKFDNGPISPKPGPTLLMVVTTAENVVWNVYSSSESNKVEPNNSRI